MDENAPEVMFLQHILVFLATAVIVVSLMRRLRISAVLGYLAAGALVGPAGLALITDTETVQDLADLGVVFLLFTIGLDLSLTRLRAMRWKVLGLGGAQVACCGGALIALSILLGLPKEDSYIIGVALAMSSTAMVFALLRERGEISSPTGRAAVAILLFQDLLVVPFLVVVPLLGGDDETVFTALAFAIVKGVLALVAIVLLGRLVLAPLFRAVAVQHNPDLLTAFSLLVVLGASWATESVGLSLALGAFLAGLLLAETEFRHQVEADIQPFRGILLGLFFMTVGMGMNLGLLLSDGLTVLGIVLSVMAIKAVLIAVICRVAGFGTGFSLNQGLLLAQTGEFAFVLFTLSIAVNALERDVGEMLILATALTIALTPLSAALGRMLAARFEQRSASDGNRLSEDAAELSDHIVVASFGRMGQIAGQFLTAHNLPYVAVDHDAGLVKTARAKGFPVYFGDASRRNVLQAAGVDRARAAIIAIDNHEAAMRAVSLLRREYPRLPILARGRDRAECAALNAIGATATVLEAMESGLLLGSAVLRAIGIEETEANTTMTNFRDNNFAALSEIIPPGGTVPERGEHGHHS